MYSEEAERFIDDVSLENLAYFLSAPHGHILGIYDGGRVRVGEDVSREIAVDERPFATAKCPGIGNLDMSYYREGWDCADLCDEAVIMGCCEDGDMSEELGDLKKQLLDDWKNREV